MNPPILGQSETSDRRTLCRTCYERLPATRVKAGEPHCEECEAYWAMIDKAIFEAKLERGARERYERIKEIR